MSSSARRRAPRALIALTVIAVAAFIAWRYAASRRDSPATHSRPLADAGWRTTRGPLHGDRYSPLSQITVDNVRELQVAWTYHTGDHDPERNTTIECTPIVVDGVLYLTTAATKVVALDAATGTERWRYDPFPPGTAPLGPLTAFGVNRGVAFWHDGAPTGAQRIFLGTADGRLISLDARTGAPDPAFGHNGTLNMREGLGMDLEGREYGMTSPPVVVDDLVICGFSVGEALHNTGPGDIRAFDARTGAERWRFHTVPQPGEAGHETWTGDAWRTRGGANAWSGLTADPERHLVFAGLGSATYDFYGGDRKGDNLYANSTLALDARTGTRVWHFQTLRHDIWDWDLPTPPVLVTVTHDGRRLDAAAQITKTGFVYLFDRATGKPLFPIEERTVRQSDIDGEQLPATQPVPVKPPPFSRQALSGVEVAEFAPEAMDKVRRDFGAFRGGELFSPTTEAGSIEFPGLHGGGNWSGGSFDPQTGWLYVNANNDPWMVRLRRRAPTPIPWVGTDIGQLGDLSAHPGIRPPWGTLSAIDLNKGEIAWQVPLGEYPDLVRRGIRGTGTENLGGTIVTAGGLVFVASTKDERIRAFDKRDGHVLWQYRLDAAGYAAPATYAVGGRQFVVIAAGGGGKLRTPSGDAFVAFALPQAFTK